MQELLTIYQFPKFGRAVIEVCVCLLDLWNWLEIIDNFIFADIRILEIPNGRFSSTMAFRLVDALVRKSRASSLENITEERRGHKETVHLRVEKCIPANKKALIFNIIRQKTLHFSVSQFFGHTHIHKIVEQSDSLVVNVIRRSKYKNRIR